MKKERRWLKSVIAASLEAPVAMPWQRGSRRKPAALRSLGAPAPVTKTVTAAAR